MTDAHDERDVTDLDVHPDDGDLAAVAKLPHCKDVTHVHVTVLGDHLTERVTATHIDKLACKNTRYSGSGVVISHRPGHPLDGLQMLPELVAEMPVWLRDAVQQAHSMPGLHTIGITHTDRKVFVIFAAVSLDDAVKLANDIEAAV